MTVINTPLHTSPGRTPARAWLALAVLMLPVLLISIDNTVLAFALPTIAEEFRATANTQLWMVDIYSLTLAALLVAMGSLGDRIGRRRVLLIGSTGFAAVSAAAAFAPSAELLVLARGVLGIFGAMLMPATMSLIRNIFEHPGARRLAIAIWAAGFTAGASLGPIVGGALLEHFHWGAVFLIAVPVLLPLVVLAPRLVPESKDPNPGPLDLASVALSFLAMLPLVWAVKSMAHEGINSMASGAIALSVVAGWSFVRRQQASATPMLDISLFRYRPFSVSLMANFLSVVGLVGLVFFMSQHLQLVLGMSPLHAGLVMLPGALASIVSGLAVVRLAERFAPHRLMVLGLLLVVVGFAMIGLLAHNLTTSAVVVSFVVLEIGVGLSQTISNDTIVSSVPANKAGAASAVSETAYELGAVIGTATLGTVLTTFYRANVHLPAGLSSGQAEVAGESLAGAVSVARDLPTLAGDHLLLTARAAFDTGIGPMAGIAGLLTLVAALVAMRALREPR